MKFIINNIYIKCIKFYSFNEQKSYIDKIGIDNILYLDDANGSDYYCYVGSNSLTGDKEFIISFSTDDNEENLNLLYWQDNGMWVLDSGNKVFIIDMSMELKKTYSVVTPLIGLWLTDRGDLLILEEAELRLINKNLVSLKNELFYSIENFTLKGDILHISTDAESKAIQLY